MSFGKTRRSTSSPPATPTGFRSRWPRRGPAVPRLARQAWHVPLLVPYAARARRSLAEDAAAARQAGHGGGDAGGRRTPEIASALKRSKLTTWLSSTRSCSIPNLGRPKVYDAVPTARTAGSSGTSWRSACPIWPGRRGRVGQPMDREEIAPGRYRDLSAWTRASGASGFWIGQDEIRRITNQSHSVSSSPTWKAPTTLNEVPACHRRRRRGEAIDYDGDVDVNPGMTMR